MIGLLSVLVLGFFLGMRHATDPDHVVAVSTIVSRHRSIRHATLIGALWGVGHTLTISVVGGGIILFGWVIPARVGLSMEFSVGLMLILLGILNLTGFMQWIADTFSPSDDSAPHQHSHGHLGSMGAHLHDPSTPSRDADSSLPWFERHLGRMGLYNAVRPLAVGLVHGLAGSAAVALLVLATIRNTEWALLYLLLFGIGTIAGMMLITGTLAIPFTFAGNRAAALGRGLRVASGLISIAFGVFVVYEMGFVHGLLTSHPQWTPR